jgi:hypothetical protein
VNSTDTEDADGVEMVVTATGVVLRDSRDGVLTFTPGAWHASIARVKAGEFEPFPTDVTFRPGDLVTVAWYEAGEPDRPEGVVVEPTSADLDGVGGRNEDGQVLVVWGPGDWRLWERPVNLRHDEPRKVRGSVHDRRTTGGGRPGRGRVRQV